MKIQSRYFNGAAQTINTTKPLCWMLPSYNAFCSSSRPKYKLKTHSQTHTRTTPCNMRVTFIKHWPKLETIDNFWTKSNFMTMYSAILAYTQTHGSTEMLILALQKTRLRLEVNMRLWYPVVFGVDFYPAFRICIMCAQHISHLTSSLSGIILCSANRDRIATATFLSVAHSTYTAAATPSTKATGRIPLAVLHRLQSNGTRHQER
jgi:hypothetical protein